MAKGKVRRGEITRYDGTVLLNKRTYERASNLLDPSRGNVPEKISLDDLADALWFVETAALSRAFVFDGTLPDDDQNDIKNWTGSLHANSGLEKLKAEPVGDRVGEFHRQDMSHASIGLLSFLTKSDGSPRKVELLSTDADLTKRDGKTKDVEGHKKFFSELESIHDILRKEDPAGVPQTASDLAAKYREDKRFRGSKCLAAIASLGPDATQAATNAYGDNSGEPLRVTGALINRFRLHYVRQLSRRSHSIYLPESKMEPLSKLDGEYAYQSCADIFTRSLADSPASKLSGLRPGSKYESATLPIGTHIFLNSKAKEPAELLNETNCFLDPYRKHILNYVWSQAAKSEQGGHLAVEKAEAEKAIEELRDRIGQAKTQWAGKKSGYLRPAFDAVATGAITGGVSYFAGEALKDWLSGWSVIGPTLEQFLTVDPAVSACVGMAFGVGQLLWQEFKRDTFQDQYRNLTLELMSTQPDKEILEQKVLQVFGRPLVMAKSET